MSGIGDVYKRQENSCATDFIADDGRDIASDITTEIFFKELFSDLTEKEKKIVSDYFIMGKQVKETATELGISTRQVSSCLLYTSFAHRSNPSRLPVVT